ncbi:hypothetical protein D3C81_365100 [compost metagenome]
MSQIHSHIRARDVRAFNMTQVGDAAVTALRRLGITIDPAVVRQQVRALAVGDASFSAPTTTGSMTTPLQFLQAWLPGFVQVITAARKIDKCIGITTIGNFHDQEVVQGVVEPVSVAAEYGDYTAIPLAQLNVNFERRTIVRGEHGMSVALLEDARAAAMNLNVAEQKRQASAIGLEIMRNAIGFFGWYNGANRTFGLMNDPSLPAYVNVAGGLWSAKDALAIMADIRTAIAALRTQSQDTIDPENTDLVLLIATAAVDFLSVVTVQGISVRDWLTQTYPRVRIESAPELNAANAAANVFYLFAEEVSAEVDGSTDGGMVFKQLVVTKFQTLGVEKKPKRYIEDFANATAGVMCTRPYAVVRYSGI